MKNQLTINILLVLFSIFLPFSVSGQELTTVEGVIKSRQTKVAVENAIVSISDLNHRQKSDKNGKFKFLIGSGDYVIHVLAKGYIELALPISIQTNKNIDLGIIFLDKDIFNEQIDDLISLNENELNDNDEINFTSGLLQASRDIFLTKAAFDFSQVFFRVRGYDSREGTVLFNGIPINSLRDGRPQFNHWGGLNDVTRNRTYTHGLSASSLNFGGLLGTTNIITRASEYRRGLRTSISGSNRTYSGRIMATYNSGLLKNKFAYSISGSVRRADQGFIEGTFYDAYSAFVSLEYKISKKQAINFTGFLASNRRGQSTAITEEVFNLVGRNYNPYWGIQDGESRNSRVRTIREPLFVLNHYFNKENFRVNTGFAYQSGRFSRTRLSFRNAPNPDPVNFRNLPSFHINSGTIPNFENAELSRNGFIENPQINWEALFQANQSPNLNGESVYFIQEDRTDTDRFIANTSAYLKINQNTSLNFGINFQNQSSDNYAVPNDLLGGLTFTDIDVFSNTRNDTNNDVVKSEGDRILYNYTFKADKLESFMQVEFEKNKWSAFLTGSFSRTSYLREGLFQNERYLNSSLGKSETLEFSNFGIKGGFTYKLTGRHIFNVRALFLNRPPLLQNSFINPREHNGIVPQLSDETIQSGAINYHLNLPKLKGRITPFYTAVKNSTDINFFFVNAGFGSDFIQEVSTGIDQLQYGVEFGLEYQFTSAFKFNFAGSYGRYLYNSNPHIAVYFNPTDEEAINAEGFLDVGISNIKGNLLNTGPQQAFSIGFEYRDPNYWWLGMNINYLSENYINISRLNRTESFAINPDTGVRFPEANDSNLAIALAQNPLESVYLVNLIGGKSFLLGDTYISLFGSVNNVLDTVFRSGGFEQSRNGNFGALRQDQLRQNPSFGPRFWYGFGRTFFINLAINF